MENDTDFVKFWNNVLEPKFTKYKHIIQGGLSRHSKAIIPDLPIKKGMSVLDVGCGWGDMTIEVAQMVSPSGRVVGIDCVDAFLEVGRKDAKKKNIDNVIFKRGDAELSLPVNEFDYVISRFGTMFFTNPVAGLKKMRLALKEGGLMTHIVWRDRKDCPAIEQAKLIALKHLPAPSNDDDNCGPGPFSMSNQETLTIMMKNAGYKNIDFKRIDEKILIGKNLDEAIEYAFTVGPAGEVVRTAGDMVTPQKKDAIEKEMRDYFKLEEQDGDGIWMQTSSWVVTSTI